MGICIAIQSPDTPVVLQDHTMPTPQHASRAPPRKTSIVQAPPALNNQNAERAQGLRLSSIEHTAQARSEPTVEASVPPSQIKVVVAHLTMIIIVKITSLIVAIQLFM